MPCSLLVYLTLSLSHPYIFSSPKDILAQSFQTYMTVAVHTLSASFRCEGGWIKQDALIRPFQNTPHPLALPFWAQSSPPPARVGAKKRKAGDGNCPFLLVHCLLAHFIYVKNLYSAFLPHLRSLKAATIIKYQNRQNHVNHKNNKTQYAPIGSHKNFIKMSSIAPAHPHPRDGS